MALSAKEKKRRADALKKAGSPGARARAQFKVDRLKKRNVGKRPIASKRKLKI